MKLYWLKRATVHRPFTVVCSNAVASSIDKEGAKSKQSEAPAVGSVSGGGRYDGLVGMFDPKGRKVWMIMHTLNEIPHPVLS